LEVPGLTQDVVSAKLLANGSKLKTEKSADGIVITLPEKAPDAIASVVKVEVK